MAKLDPTQVRVAINRLAIARPSIFGANGHKFKFTCPLSEEVVAAFERHHKISLPEDYRNFMTQISNGGAGPYYGIFPLGQMDEGNSLKPWREGDEMVGKLDAPFSLREAWNDLSGMPPEDLRKTNESEYWRKMDAFDKEYQNPSRMNGAISICHKGCALRVWLVVAGQDSGHLWEDHRADYSGLFPQVIKDGSRATFSSWYAEWLEDALRIAAIQQSGHDA